jgi:hypothetical protein
VALDQLVNKLREVLQFHFGAKLVDTSMTMNQVYDPIMTLGGSLVGTFNHLPTTELNLTVRESETRLFSEALRSGLFQELMGHSARLVSMSTEFTSKKISTTRVHLMIGDVDELVASIEKYSWDAYDKQFNALIKETLTDQV